MRPDAGAELRSRVAVSQLLDALGPSLLTVLAAPAGPARDVVDVAIHDPVDPGGVAPGELVLGVGVQEPGEVRALLERLGGLGAAGLVVKQAAAADLQALGPQAVGPQAVGPQAVDPQTRAAVQASGVPVLGLAHGASWAHVGALVRSLLLPGAGTGDARNESLFGLADAVSALLDAPVTIEDAQSRVLAFSGNQDQTDVGRRETVLGRRVPERFTSLLTERGVFRHLREATSPVYVDDLVPAVLPRVAVSVRAGNEVLGSMWAVVPGPLSAERERGFVEAAKVVALHLLRLRAGADVGRRLRADLLATLLEGAGGAAEAAGRLGVAGDCLCVLAAAPAAGDGRAGPGPAGSDPADEGAPQRLADALGVYLAALRPRSAIALLGDVVYAVVTLHAETDPEVAAVVGLVQDFLQRAQEGAHVRVGVGRPASSIVELARSRVEAERALRAVCHDRAGRRRIARFADVQLDSLMLRLADLVAEDGGRPPGPVGVLAAHDAEHGSDLVASLAAYLDAFGEIRRAAAAVHVHPNTFRYRLGRIEQVSGLDLADADARFAAALQLRLERFVPPTAPRVDHAGRRPAP